ncbi:NAD(+) diphosphatase [Arthrobacter psychrochitiniphilus]|uniref:NAD(+) diphosphatase n=1 Tax=Arthrobacter psychrochitiniphilus TaxID=291045 RepID=A0A2V3DNI1_9MICC|nr:NAD(+) diphosphatase [Arthrobacter psychrochitiniphilus]NYG18435.1 NAD+ diphosphatase [Arthrobacter psychrochitiniphilus]PXA64533.1 NAD(+) diphosphatase [Arthrobacter psychrochitiniphilus]
MTKPNTSPDVVLDRQCEQRNEQGFLETVMSTGTYRAVIFHNRKALISEPEHSPDHNSPDYSVTYLSPTQLPRDLPAGTQTVYLGKVLPGQGHPLAAGTPLILFALPHDAGELGWVPDGSSFMGYRDVGQQLRAADAQIVIQAQAVANWHATHTFCPRCGNPMEPMKAGWMRRCVQDGSEHFPRTDPAAIVAIVGADERILLANNFQWDQKRYSTVAGFVEAGESAEAGAVREIAEEVGVRLHALHYVASQAWPFPRSLMLGYIGYTNDTVATPDLTEVRAAKWFSRAELQGAVLNGEAVISSRASIARELIEHWYGGKILEPGEQA